MKIITVLFLAILQVQAARAQMDADLEACYNKQALAIHNGYVTLTYTEQLNELYHSPRPWQQMHYTGTGRLWYNAEALLKQDTLTADKRTLYSTMQLDSSALLLIDYGEKAQSSVSKSLYAEKLIESARYTPALLISYFARHRIMAAVNGDRSYSVYKTNIHQTEVRLYIRKRDQCLAKITTLANDDLRGDVLSTYTYYKEADKMRYPRTITIEKMNGRLKDRVQITGAALSAAAPALLEKPSDYQITDEKAVVQTLTTEKYNDHLYFALLQPNGSRVAIIVFRDFILISGAPLNAANGELIIAAARSIAPGKPIRYFSFGHHHPDYVGGLRAFVHKGVTILGVADDKNYLSSLVAAPHTLLPDSLQLQPSPLKWETIKDSAIISNGGYALHIYHIGEKSGHTEDYLVYYFPKEKLLLEDDLVWIEKGTEMKKASKRQAGLYQAIKDLGLDVQLIMQSWGHAYDNYKMDIPFSDLEQSASMN